jgi:ADP-L-glycero-D-manno-heptose 6-epimerase
MYIVTGGAGFIGSAMIWKLNSLGIDNILAVDNLGLSEKWKNLVNRRYAGYMHRDEFLDLIRRDALEEATGEKVTAIVHMGACSSTAERDADFLMRNNLEYSKTLCVFALEKKARFITAGSAATYGTGSRGFDDDVDRLGTLRPLSIYGYSKHLFDLWAKRRGLFDRIVCLKFFNVYGPNEYHKGDMRSVVHKTFGSIRETGGMELFRSDHPAYPDGGQRRDFVHVKDCAAIICWLLENPRICGLFNVGTGAARTWNDVVRAVSAAMEVPAEIRYKDMPDALKGRYQNFTEAPMDRLRGAGYTAPLLTLEQGITDYVTGYLMNPDPYL